MSAVSEPTISEEEGAEGEGGAEGAEGAEGVEGEAGEGGEAGEEGVPRIRWAVPRPASAGVHQAAAADPNPNLNPDPNPDPNPNPNPKSTPSLLPRPKLGRGGARPALLARSSRASW